MAEYRSVHQIWWKDPCNKEWQRFITKWIMWGSLFILVWSLSYYFYYVIVVHGDLSIDVMEWHRNYTSWLVSCFAIIFVLAFAFFLSGLHFYKKTHAFVRFSKPQLLLVFLCVIVFWPLAILIVFRPIQTPSIRLALFDMSLMPGLLVFLMGVFHVAITRLCRAPRDKGEG